MVRGNRCCVQKWGCRYVKPSFGLRVGDWKLLLGCFNTSTLQPQHGTPIELYNIAADPLELSEASAANPAVVTRLMARLAGYAASKDQVPPTVFYPYNETGHTIAPWNYQCPQCRHGGALPGPDGNHFDPWCDNVTCGVGPPAPNPDPGPPSPPPAPAPAPTPRCPAPWKMFNGGMGGAQNKDVAVRTGVAGWEDCCVLCIGDPAAGDSACKGWTYFTDGSESCHLHANQADQHPGLAHRITGV